MKKTKAFPSVVTAKSWDRTESGIKLSPQKPTRTVPLSDVRSLSHPSVRARYFSILELLLSHLSSLQAEIVDEERAQEPEAINTRHDVRDSPDRCQVGLHDESQRLLWYVERSSLGMNAIAASGSLKCTDKSGRSPAALSELDK